MGSRLEVGGGGRRVRREWRVPAALLALSAVPLAAGAFRVTQLGMGAEVTAENARFVASPVPVVVHIVGAALFTVLGAFQFVHGLRRRRPRWHRAAGRVVAVSGLAVGFSALWMALSYPWPEDVGVLLTGFRLAFGTTMVVAIVLAIAAIRRRDVVHHRAWMIRAYALGLGAGTQVLTLGFWSVAVGEPGVLSTALLQAAAWVINLAVAEVIIRTRPIPPARMSARRVARSAGRGLAAPVRPAALREQ